MGYSSYKSLKQTLKKLKLEQSEVALFPTIERVKASSWLNQTLKNAKRMPLTNEKSKSERVISPILLEVALQYEKQITLFSGEDLTVDVQNNLSGPCDFFFAKHPRKSVMEAPIITLVEAKNENFEYGQAQCIAQMYAAQLYNQQEGRAVPYIYGCAVTADVWKFLKLEDNHVYIDIENYYLIEIDKILGIFNQIIQGFLAEN